MKQRNTKPKNTSVGSLAQTSKKTKSVRAVEKKGDGTVSPPQRLAKGFVPLQDEETPTASVPSKSQQPHSKKSGDCRENWIGELSGLLNQGLVSSGSCSEVEAERVADQMLADYCTWTEIITASRVVDALAGSFRHDSFEIRSMKSHFDNCWSFTSEADAGDPVDSFDARPKSVTPREWSYDAILERLQAILQNLAELAITERVGAERIASNVKWALNALPLESRLEFARKYCEHDSTHSVSNDGPAQGL